MSGHGDPIPMTSRKGGALRGEAHVPGDKSISHRSLILGAMAVGETKITGLLEGQDVLDTGRAMAAFGAEVVNHGGGEWSVHGVGVGGFGEPDNVIDCGNSGTGVRLIMGTMATSPISVTFTGDASLNKRPMARVTDPLALFGAQAVGREGARKVALLNQQTTALRRQLDELQGLLDAANAADKASKVQIKALGANLNQALARVASEQRKTAVETQKRLELEEAERKRLEAETKDLKKFRSEFFGRLRDVLGSRRGIRIVGDRFVFSSEILFGAGSAELGLGGKIEIDGIGTLSNTVVQG